jgi:phage-related protein
MANIRTLKLNLLADVSNFNKELATTQDKLKGFQNSLKKAGQVSTIALGGLAAAGFTAVKAAEEVAVANARLDNILTSMGYADATKRVTDYASALEVTTAVDAEVIKLTQAKLATFANLAATVDTAGGAFDRATVAALDMAAAGFGTAESNAVQLGKALEDPIKGINALTRSGITFTEEEKKKIETLVKSGDLLAAQTMVLEAIEKQVGGTAEATATGSAKMALALGNVSEAIGAALLPLFTDLSAKIVELTPFLEANAGMFLKVGAAIVVVAVAVKTLQLGIAALSLVMQIATGITAAFNFVLAMNPIGLIVLAVAALAAAFVLAYQKIEPFKNLIDGIFDSLQRVGNAIANNPLTKGIGAIIKNVSGRAAGGSVSAGQTVRVGEFGAEYFTPNSSGVIRRDGGGAGNTFIFNGVIDGESARRSIEELLQNSARRTGAVNFVGATL